MAAADSVGGERIAGSSGSLPPLSLYIHFPWCIKKCPYCDFNSHQRRGDIHQQTYITALLRDLDHDLTTHACANRKLISIFMGGGTPSLFGATAIARLLSEIKSRIAFHDAIEITMEANPGAVEHDDFAAYRRAGVNRVSLGAQSFNDAHLEQLGRIHNAGDIRDSIRAACDAGFANLNLDLMYGLPEQTPQAALDDLETALEFSTAHLSLYQLTIEPNTWFHRHPPKLPAHDCIMEMQEAMHKLARERGHERYEVSAHATAGRRCRHNLNYWQFGDYLGIGAGAHGKITRRGGITRYWKHKHPQRYLDSVGDGREAGQAVGGTGEVAGGDVLFEFLMNALRLTDGFDANLIPARTGRSVGEGVAVLGDAIGRGLVVYEKDRIRCSAQGYLFLNDVLQGVLAGEEGARGVIPV